MEIKILHFYPNLMNLYGSYANLMLLGAHLEAMGHQVRIETVDYEQQVDIASADLIFMGAGTERSQKAALADFARYGEAVCEAARNGMPMLFCGSAMELLGRTITDENGKEYEGIGLSDFVSVQHAKRLVEDVYGKTELYDEAVIGFMNKGSVITGVKTPLLSSTALGFGNEGRHTPEGYHEYNVFASYMTGPILAKNPRLMDVLIRAILTYKGAEIPASLPTFADEEEGYAITAEQLRLRCEQ